MVMEALRVYLDKEPSKLRRRTQIDRKAPEERAGRLRGLHYDRALQGLQSLNFPDKLVSVHLGAQSSQHVLAVDTHVGEKARMNWRVLAPIPLDHLSSAVAPNDDVLYCHHEQKWCAAPWWESKEGMVAARSWLIGGAVDPRVLESRLPQLVTIVGDEHAMIAFITIARLLRAGATVIVTGAIDPSLWSLCIQCFEKVSCGPQLLVAKGFQPLGKLLKKLDKRAFKGVVIEEEWIREHTPECLEKPTVIFGTPCPGRGKLFDIKDAPLSQDAECVNGKEDQKEPVSSGVATNISSKGFWPNPKRAKGCPMFRVKEDGMRRMRVVFQEAKGLLYPPYRHPPNAVPKCTPFSSNWAQVPSASSSTPSNAEFTHEVMLLESAAFVETMLACVEGKPQRVFSLGLLYGLVDKWEKENVFTPCTASADLAFVWSKGDLVPSAVTGIKALKKKSRHQHGGDLILRFPWRIHSMFEAGFFLLLAACFEEVRLFQPQASTVRFFVGLNANDLPALKQLEALAIQVPRDDPMPHASCVSARCFSPFGDLRRYLLRHEWKEMDPVGHPMRYLSRNVLKKWMFPGAERRRVWLACGSFDPIHENHIRAALWTLKSRKAHHVFFVANTETNPYKRVTDVEIRSALIQSRIKELEKSGEIQPGQMQVTQFRMPDSNWPAREALAEHMEKELFQEEEQLVEVGYLLGQDSFEKSYQYGTKHKNTGIFNLKKRPIPVLVFPRSNLKEVYIPDNFRHCIELADGYSEQPMSSSEIRQAIAEGKKPCTSMLHPRILGDIKARGLYQKIHETADMLQTHYDAQAEECGERMDAIALNFRNSNNFGKAVTIERALSLARTKTGSSGPLSVLDLGCGKGGDIRKFQNAGVAVYVGVDTAEQPLVTAVKRAEEAQEDAMRAKHGDLKGGSKTMMIFAQGDYTTPLAFTGLAEGLWFHAVSAQMTIHYAFTSEKNVRALLQNVTEKLIKGGIFFGTIPNSEMIIERLPKIEPHVIEEGHCSLRFATEQFEKLEKWPRECYNVIYTYSLPGAVHLPEPLAHVPTLIKLAGEYGLQLAFGPTPLNTIVTDALEEQGGGGGVVGRLKRLYFYKGGMTDTNADSLGLYYAFAFEKVEESNGPDGEALSAEVKKMQPGVHFTS